MADSSMIIDSGNITTFADEVANDPDLLDSTIAEIVDKFNALIETATGHDHDGTNSKSVSAGIGNLSLLEVQIARIMGGFA